MAERVRTASVARAVRWLAAARAREDGGRGCSVGTAQEGHLSLQKVTLLALSAGAATPTATYAEPVACRPVNKAIPDPLKTMATTMLLTRQQFQRGF
jgi:hypothetical protein